ncbi:MAG: secondary thiamine-phosphate synthase enzyme YjbQ, partial [candidate division Zixibacteria bacterium]
MNKIHYTDVRTDKRNQFLDISDTIRDLVSQSAVTEGSVEIFIPHTTAAVTINENADPTVQSDILDHLEKLIPRSERFRHSEGNSDSHIKASLIGSRLSIFISSGKLVL